MFWRFGGYANISTIDTILDKPDVSLEEVLDESDLIQELKQHNSKLIEYLRDDKILQRLLEYVVAPAPASDDDDDEWEDETDEEEEEPQRKSISPLRSLSLGRSKEQKSARQEERAEQDNQEKARQKYAYVASEVLSSETWSIIESLMENQQYLRKFWEFIRQEAPIDPVTAGYFTKINETLLDKKTEETLDFVKSLDGIIPAMLQHVDCPMIMDLLLKIISMEKAEGGQGIVDWLHSQNLVPMLLAFLGEEHPTFTQTSAGDFIKAIITISANASQNEQSCIGPNSLTRQLVSETCIESMIADMLKGGNPLTVGVGIIIEVIRKNNSDYDPEITMGNELPPSTSDPIYLGTLLRLFAKHVPDFTHLILSPNHTVSKGLQEESTVTEKRKDLEVAFGNSIEPLGFDRFKTCELMAELLHCSNMGLLNEKGSEDYIGQRDKERERLKAEGALTKAREPQSAITEFSEDDSSLVAGEGSPAESRKLEVTNSAEDDGFEDVGASSDIKDEIKEEDVDTSAKKPTNQLKRSTSRVSLDDEFVDEPLSSPKPDSAGSDKRNEPSSPTAVKSVSKEPESGDTDTPKEEGKSATDDLVDEITAHLSPQTSPDAPPLPKREALTTSTEAEAAVAAPQNEADKPAPLFASRTEDANQSQAPSDWQQPQEPTDQQNLQESPFVHKIESDVDGKPIVGDYLKMQFVEHKVVPTILDFFFRFPWNNFLHNVVYDVVQQVFNGPMDRGYNRNLAFDLFQTGRITERIIEGQLKSDEVTAQKSMRLGYMGHLTLVAEEVVKFSERHPPEMLSEQVLDHLTAKIWSDYVENTLTETRDRDNAILGGVRPDMAGGPRQAVLNAVNAASGFASGASPALVNAGLNGGGTGLDSMDLANQQNASFLSGGSLLSGFGSSSDEEDEDMEEIGEHDESGGAETGSDQYPTYTPSSLSALSVFSASPQHSPNAAANAPPSTPDDPSGALSPEPTSNPMDATPSDTGSSSDPSSTPPSQTGASVPPPLNIPPSRARRQLQARLALSKEKAEREAAERDGGGGSSGAGLSPTGSPSASPPEAEAGHQLGESQGAAGGSPKATMSASESLDELLRKAKSGAAGVEEAASEAIRRVDEERRRASGRAAAQGERDRGVGGLGSPFSPSKSTGAGVAVGSAAGGAGSGGSPEKPKARPARPGLGMRGDSGLPQAARNSHEGQPVPRLNVRAPTKKDDDDDDDDDDRRGDGEGQEEGEGDGEDVPLKISTSPRTSGGGVVGRMKALFSSGKGSEDGEEGSEEDDEVGSLGGKLPSEDKPQGLAVRKAARRTSLDE